MAVPEATPAAPRLSILAPLAVRSFRYLWGASILWHFARWVEMVVVGWSVLELTDSPWLVAVVGFARSAPLLVFGLIAGAMGDRVERKRLLVGSQLANLAIAAGLLASAATGALAFGPLIAASLLFGLTWAVDWPSRRAMVMDLVGRERLESGVLLEIVSMNVTKILGPVTGGLLLDALGLTPALAALFGLHAMGLLLLLPIRTPAEMIVVAAGSIWRNVLEGLRYCRHNEVILGVLVVTVVMNLLSFPYQQMLPVVARDHLGVSASGLGLLAASDGIGAMLGALALIATGQRRRARGWLYIGGSLGMNVAVGLFALTTELAPAVLLLSISGVSHLGFSIYQGTIILSNASAPMRGRAMGVLTLAIGAGPPGILLVGALSSALGATVAIGLEAAVAFALIAAAAALLPALRAERG